MFIYYYYYYTTITTTTTTKLLIYTKMSIKFIDLRLSKISYTSRSIIYMISFIVNFRI